MRRIFVYFPILEVLTVVVSRDVAAGPAGGAWGTHAGALRPEVAAVDARVAVQPAPTLPPACGHAVVRAGLGTHVASASLECHLLALLRQSYMVLASSLSQ